MVFLPGFLDCNFHPGLSEVLYWRWQEGRHCWFIATYLHMEMACEFFEEGRYF